VQQVLDKNVNIDFKDNDGRTPSEKRHGVVVNPFYQSNIMFLINILVVWLPVCLFCILFIPSTLTFWGL
jgi:hypothetical protein